MDFTLHQDGDGFIGEVCQHDQKLTDSEVLLLIVRVRVHSTLTCNLYEASVTYLLHWKE